MSYFVTPFSKKYQQTCILVGLKLAADWVQGARTLAKVFDGTYAANKIYIDGIGISFDTLIGTNMSVKLLNYSSASKKMASPTTHTSANV